MATNQIHVERCSVVSSHPFEQVVAAFEKALGHPEMNAFIANMNAAQSFAELEKMVRGAVGPSDLMEFARIDLGAVLRKKNGIRANRSVRFIVGNPVTMSKMVEHVPDAGSYAPVIVLIDERNDGVHLSYDRMASFLASYENVDALKVARDRTLKSKL
jgi:uncharacterized protein (DUF302 family)